MTTRNLVRFSSLFLVAVAAMAASYAAGFATALEVRKADAGLPTASGGPEAGSPSAPAASGASGSEVTDASVPPNFGVFWEAWNQVEEEFYGELPAPEDVTYGAIRGSLRALDDPYTVFTDPTDTEINRPNLQGEFEGIGAFVTQDADGRLIIQSPMPGQPAEKAGLQAGDIVVAVDGVDITDLDISDAVLLIRGPKGTVVRLTVAREGEPEVLEFEVERDRIEIPSVDDVRTIEAAGRPTLGYLRLTEFAADTTKELETAMAQLRSDGAEGLIVDVRNDPGGFLSTAIGVASEFIDSGTVVIQENASGIRREEKARSGGQWLDLPVVILMNRGSASASEILAGAIRDHDRGTLVGDTTFGKGSVQNVHTLSDKSQLRVTVAVWRTPGGDLIHGQGIAPDVEVERTRQDIEADRDPQLDRAEEELVRLIGGS